MLYNPVKVNIPLKFHEKIKKNLEEERREDGGKKKKKSVSVKIDLNYSNNGEDTLLLTRGQIAKMERARLIGKKTMTIRMSHNQVKANLKHEGGFLGMLIAALSAAIPSLISAATAAAPAVLASAATGAISGAISKAVSGDGVYFQKNGLSARLQPVHGGGLYLSPHPITVQGDGLYLKRGNKMYGQMENNHWIKEQVPILELLL